MLLFKLKRLSKHLIMLLATTMLVGCGGDDGGGGVPAQNVFGNGFTGNTVVDQQIIAQIPCDQMVGSGTRASIAVRDQGGFLQPLVNPVIPAPQQFGYQYPNQFAYPNNNMQFQLSQAAIGRTSVGDVVIAVFGQGYTDIIISMCHRYHVQSNFLDFMSYSLVGNFNPMFTMSSCGYGALGTGSDPFTGGFMQEYLSLSFTDQWGGFSPPVDMFPTTLYGVNCNNNQYGYYP